MLPFDGVFGTDLCWNEATREALVMALTSFARAASGQGAGGRPRVIYGHWNRSDAVTSSLVRDLLSKGCCLRVLHPLDWTPSPGGFLSELLSQGLPPNEVFARSPLLAAATKIVNQPKLSLSGECDSSSGGGCGAEDDEDYAAAMFQDIFESEAQDVFPNPVFFVFEVLVPRMCFRCPVIDHDADRST